MISTAMAAAESNIKMSRLVSEVKKLDNIKNEHLSFSLLLYVMCMVKYSKESHKYFWCDQFHVLQMDRYDVKQNVIQTEKRIRLRKF
jgi:hypothetical protein